MALLNCSSTSNNHKHLVYPNLNLNYSGSSSSSTVSFSLPKKDHQGRLRLRLIIRSPIRRLDQYSISPPVYVYSSNDSSTIDGGGDDSIDVINIGFGIPMKKDQDEDDQDVDVDDDDKADVDDDDEADVDEEDDDDEDEEEEGSTEEESKEVISIFKDLMTRNDNFFAFWKWRNTKFGWGETLAIGFGKSRKKIKDNQEEVEEEDNNAIDEVERQLLKLFETLTWMRDRPLAVDRVTMRILK